MNEGNDYATHNTRKHFSLSEKCDLDLHIELTLLFADSKAFVAYAT